MTEDLNSGWVLLLVGMVRLSLGNNLELGGNVDGQGIFWLFFPNATVSANNKTIVKDGILVE